MCQEGINRSVRSLKLLIQTQRRRKKRRNNTMERKKVVRKKKTGFHETERKTAKIPTIRSRNLCSGPANDFSLPNGR